MTAMMTAAVSPKIIVAAAVLQLLIDRGGRPHALWQVIPYLILTVGEVLVSVTGLEFAYTQAPPAMKSVIMSLWYVTIAAGSGSIRSDASGVEINGAAVNING
mgnify:CR=1 FL=1